MGGDEDIDQTWLGFGRSDISPEFTHKFMPTATREQADAFNEQQRLSASADCAVRYLEALVKIDVRHLLAEVRSPTLLDLPVSIAAGRELAAGIPNARFVALPGKNHVILEQDPGWRSSQGRLKSFVRVRKSSGSRAGS